MVGLRSTQGPEQVCVHSRQQEVSKSLANTRVNIREPEFKGLQDRKGLKTGSTARPRILASWNGNVIIFLSLVHQKNSMLRCQSEDLIESLYTKSNPHPSK